MFRISLNTLVAVMVGYFSVDVYCQEPIPDPEEFLWTNTSIGGGGFTLEIRIDPFDNYAQSGNPVLYLATDVSGVYRSFDKGVSWEMLYHNATLAKNTLGRYTTSIAFRDTSSRRIIVGTSEGVYLWKNGNSTWKGAVFVDTLFAGIDDEDGLYPWIGIIRENPHDTVGLDILAGVGDVRNDRFGMSAVLRSTTISVEPDSFQLVRIDGATDTNEVVYDIDFYQYDGNNTLYTFITTNRGIYLSEDMFDEADPDDVNFTKISGTLDDLRGLVLLAESTPGDSVVAFATVYDETTSGSGGLYRNEDILQSISWSRTSSQLDRLGNIRMKPGSTLDDYEVFVSRKNMSWLAVTVKSSTIDDDGDLTKIADKNDNQHNGYRTDDTQLRFGSLTVADNGDVYGTWGYGPIKALAEANPKDNRDYQQIFTKSKGIDADNDSTYEAIGMCEVFSGSLFAFDPDNSSIIYVGATDNGLLRSMNGGLTWSQRRMRNDDDWEDDYGKPTQTVHHVAVRKFSDTLMVLASAAVKREPGALERQGELLQAKWDGGKGDETDWMTIAGGDSLNGQVNRNLRGLPSGAIPGFVFDQNGTNADSERVYCAVRGRGIYWGSVADTNDFIAFDLSDIVDEANIGTDKKKSNIRNFSRIMFDPSGNDTLYVSRNWPAGGVFKIVLDRLNADTVAVDTIIEVIAARWDSVANERTTISKDDLTADVHSLLVTDDYVFAGISQGGEVDNGYRGGLVRWDKSDSPGDWDWVIGGPTGNADSLISIGGIVEDPEDLGNDFWAVTFRFAKKGIDNYKLMGLYKSTDSGATWSKVDQPDDDDDKLKFANGLSMAFKPTPDTHNTLFLITRGNGIWKGQRSLPAQ